MNIYRTKYLFSVILLLTVLCAGSISAQTEIVDNGDFKISFAAAAKKRNARARQVVRAAEAEFTGIVEELNGIFNLPQDVFIKFKECGEANAFYDPNTRTILYCYELVESYYKLFKDEAQDEDDLGEKVAGGVIFILFHELGHALVDVLDLPITGREEDAVDRLSVVLLVEGADEGADLAFSGATAFLLEDDEITEDFDFADEHSFNKQRFFDIVCLLYGQNPEKYEALISEEVLPEKRAANCQTEYEKTRDSWFKILEPFVKDEEETNSLVGVWSGKFNNGASELVLTVKKSDERQIAGNVRILKTSAGNKIFTAPIANGTIRDFPCQASVISRCVVTRLRLENNRLKGTLLFNNSNNETAKHEFILVKNQNR